MKSLAIASTAIALLGSLLAAPAGAQSDSPSRTTAHDAHARANEQLVSITDTRIVRLKARQYAGEDGSGAPKFKSARHKVYLSVLELDEREPSWDYYFLRMTSKRLKGATGGGFMSYITWTDRKVNDTSYTRSFAGKKTQSTCADITVGLNKAIGAFSAGVSKSFSIMCGTRAKVKFEPTTSTAGRGGHWTASHPELVRTAQFYKAIRVRAGKHPAFHVRLGAPCHYYDYHGGLSLKNCYKYATLSYHHKKL